MIILLQIYRILMDLMLVYQILLSFSIAFVYLCDEIEFIHINDIVYG